MTSPTTVTENPSARSYLVRRKEVMGAMSITARLQEALDDSPIGRRVMAFASRLRRVAAPTHWTGLFGIMTAACVAVLVGTGVVLMFFYAPSSERVVYEGGYLPWHGVEMSG